MTHTLHTAAAAERPSPTPTTTTRRYRWQWVVIALGLTGILGAMAAPLALRTYTAQTYGALHYAVNDVPGEYRVAVVFGARVLSNDRLSTVLRDRVATAIDLYHAGKVDVLLMTGDGRSDDYNEPRAMRAYAISRGVPPTAIVVDEGGLRTYDSCYRAHNIFALERAVLVTQDFHLDRALYLCNALGMDAVGVPADYQRPDGYRDGTIRGQQFRELAATSVAFFDLLLGEEPTVQGDPQPIELP
jgi:SanA protein